MRITRKQIKQLVDIIDSTALDISFFEIIDEQQATIHVKYKKDYFKFSVTKLEGTANNNYQVYYKLDVYPVDKTTVNSFTISTWEQAITHFKQWVKDVEDDILTQLPIQSLESNNTQISSLIDTFKSTAKDLLVKDKFDELFNFLFTHNKDEEIKNSLIIVKSEHRILQKHIINNTIDNQELSINRNRLMIRILKVVEEVAKQINK